MSIDTADAIDYVNDKQAENSYEFITENRVDVYNRSAIFGHGVVTASIPQNDTDKVNFFVWFRARNDDRYTCLKAYAKTKGRAVTILRNHYKRTYKQSLPN